MYLGKCLCGAVHVQVTGEISEVIHCHCSLCRKNSGTAYATNGFVNTNELELTDITNQLKIKILKMGASEVGITKLDSRFIYSHIGRGPEPYGQEIDLNHKYAIVFTLEMDYEAVEQAPDIPITEETAKQYLNGANISVSIAKYIRSL